MTVHASADEVAARLPWIGGRDQADRRAPLRVPDADDDLEWLALRIAMLGADVDVREPPELLITLRAVAERLHRAAGEPE